MKKTNEIILNQNNIERLHSQFYRVYFGHYVDTYFDPQNKIYFHPPVHRYVKISDIEKSKDFYDALMKFEETFKGYNILTTLSPKDNLIYSKKFIFVPTFWNAKLVSLFEVKTACKKLLEIAKKQGIGFYKKHELRRVAMQDLQLEK